MKSESIFPLLKPQTVAIIGASRQPGSLGRDIFDNLVQAGFTGKIFPINPKIEELANLRVYPNIAAVAEPVDLAVIAIPKDHVLAVLEECGKSGVKVSLIITAGFGEGGKEGRERQDKLREIQERYGMRVVGPNCMGVMNTDPKIKLNASFSPVFPPAGNVALATQSGSLGQAIVDYAQSLGIGFSSFVSIGNRLDVNERDLLEYWGEDPHTQIILFYMESFEHAEGLISMARKVSKKKPILVIHGGKTKVGEKTVHSHTGSLAGSEQAAQALFDKAGMLSINTLDELFGVTSILTSQVLPKGRRVAILTNAGGPGVIAADQCEKKGLEVTSLTSETQKQLKNILPEEASVQNPVDIIATATGETYRQAFKILARDPNVDSILIIFIAPANRDPVEFSREVHKEIQEMDLTKTILACFLVGSGRKRILASFGEKRLPIFSFPEQAIDALAKVCALQEQRNRQRSPLKIQKTVSSNVISEIFKQDFFLDRNKQKWLSHAGHEKLFGAFQIPTCPQATGSDKNEILKAAKEIRYPVVLKVISPHLLHKTETKAVRLNMANEYVLESNYKDLSQMLKKKDIPWESFLVQKMIPDGIEIAIGVNFHPGIGHVLMFGKGGTAVELWQDLSFALLPVCREEIEDLFLKTKVSTILKGYRGEKPFDEDALINFIFTISDAVSQMSNILEWDLNPVRVFAEGKGLMVLDSRLSFR